jgi:MoaA/NifB/PqqE/SkfB family radical SAM enzyme
MDDSLFRKIIYDLAEMGFDGRLSFHFYNEPLLDDRIIQFISFSRSELEGARIHLFTNGDLLTPGRIRQLIAAGTNLIRVSLHDRKAKEKLRTVINKTPPDAKRKIRLHSYYEGKEPMYNRGETLAMGKDLRLYDYSKGCYWGTSVVINYEGKVVLCCNDFHAEHTFGDLSFQSLSKVWQRSKKIRQEIFLGKYTLEICKKCTGT